MALELKDGKFYRDGKFEAAEIGNQEQINLLVKTEQRVQAFKDGLPVDVDYKTVYIGRFDFECLCGKKLFVEDDDMDDEDFDTFIGRGCKCQKCQREYIFGEKDNCLTVKLNP